MDDLSFDKQSSRRGGRGQYGRYDDDEEEEDEEDLCAMMDKLPSSGNKRR